MTIQRIALTEATRRMKQIRQFAHDDRLVVLTSHDKPTLIVIEVERCQRLLEGAEQLVHLLAADSLLEVARAISAVDAIGLSGDRDWIRQVLEDLGRTERAG